MPLGATAPKRLGTARRLQPFRYRLGRGCGVGRSLGIGLPRGVGVGRGVAVGVGVGVGVPAWTGAWIATAVGDPVLKKSTVAFVACGG